MKDESINEVMALFGADAGLVASNINILAKRMAFGNCLEHDAFETDHTESLEKFRIR